MCLRCMSECETQKAPKRTESKWQHFLLHTAFELGYYETFTERHSQSRSDRSYNDVGYLAGLWCYVRCGGSTRADATIWAPKRGHFFPCTYHEVLLIILIYMINLHFVWLAFPLHLFSASELLSFHLIPSSSQAQDQDNTAEKLLTLYSHPGTQHLVLKHVVFNLRGITKSIFEGGYHIQLI